MAGKFERKRFADIDVNDSFFDSLKEDYPGTSESTGFESWFQKKARDGAEVYVFCDERGVAAFVCVKPEDEEIQLAGVTLPKKKRLKICTLRVAERCQGQRLGEGAVGLSLWEWRNSGCEEVYLTTFEKHELLIDNLLRFGFSKVGQNRNGECVFLRSRNSVDYTDPYKSFPFINPQFEKGGYIVVEDRYHDKMFSYSELKNAAQDSGFLDVANGVSKTYVGAQRDEPHYKRGEPVFIYRKHTGTGQKQYKSCVTSYCVVTDVVPVKVNGRVLMEFDDVVKLVRNKSVFSRDELEEMYKSGRNMYIVEMLYYGYFGEGNNIPLTWLVDNKLWSYNMYPTLIRLSPEKCRQILTEGKVNVDDVIIG